MHVGTLKARDIHSHVDPLYITGCCVLCVYE